MANAVLMASGLGSRMRPLTNTKPKPLIEVKGIPMIETVITALNHFGVNNIYIVVGYLGDQFNYLTEKYDNVSLIKNKDYETVNNISSIFYARNEMSEDDVFVCEADLYISDINIINQADIQKSGYFGKMVKGHSDDWVFEQNEDGIITRVGKIGDDLYNMVGLSFFKKDKASIIAEEVERVYNNQPDFKDLFWDDVVNRILNKLNLTVFPVEDNQIVEIDTVKELEAVNGR